MPYRGAYNASKFAIEGFADTLRLEVKPDNIQVSLIEPGPIVSDFEKMRLLSLSNGFPLNTAHTKKTITQ